MKGFRMALKDKTPSSVAPEPPRTLGKSPLESKVAAVTEAPPGTTQGPCLSPASHPRLSPKKPKCQRVKLTQARTTLAESFQPDAMDMLSAQDGRPNGSSHAEEGARRGGPGRPWPPASGLACWHRPGLQPLDTGRKRTVLQENMGLGASPELQNKVPAVPSPRTSPLYPHRDGLGSTSLTSGNRLVPKSTLYGGLWRAGELGAPGTGASPLSLSERVEKNRLLLKEMLRGGGPAPLKPGPPGWDRAAPGRPAGDMDGDSKLTRTCGSPPEPTLRPGQDKQPAQGAHMKARTRPLRASHDIVPTLAPDSRSFALVTCHRPQEQEVTDPPWTPASRPALRSCPLSSPHAGHPPLSTNNCNNRGPGGLSVGGRTEVDPLSLKPQPALESPGHGTPQAAVGCGLSQEPGCSQEAEGALRRAESTSGRPASSRQSQDDHSGPSPSPPASLGQNKRSSSRGSFASGLGLKKLVSALSQVTRPTMGRTRSHSVEQLQSPTPGLATRAGTPEAKRAPSLQFLHLVSRSPQHRKAASFHNLQALLSSRGDRASVYLVQEPAGEGAVGSSRPVGALPRRTLSVEDVGAPSLARTVGRVVAAFPDGTSQLQLQCAPGGTFGFCVATGNGRRDSGLYVREMADVGTAKLYSGLLAVGDEILEVNGAKVAALGTTHVQELLARANSVSLRVLRQRPAPR